MDIAHQHRRQRRPAAWLAVGALAVLAACAGGGEDPAFTGTADEWLAERQRCLEEAGWPVTREPGSGALAVPEVPAGQHETTEVTRLDVLIGSK